MDYFASGNSDPLLTEASKAMAFDFALAALTMIPWSERNCYEKYPVLPAETWKDDRSACEVVGNVIRPDRALNRHEVDRVTEELSAKTLSECGLTLKSTHDLRQHLRLDQKAKQVHVYHHVGFLKASLRARHGSAFEAINQSFLTTS